MKSHQDDGAHHAAKFEEEHQVCASDADAEVDSGEPEASSEVSPTYEIHEVVHTHNAENNSSQHKPHNINFYDEEPVISKDVHEVKHEEHAHPKEHFETLHKIKEDNIHGKNQDNILE